MPSFNMLTVIAAISKRVLRNTLLPLPGPTTGRFGLCRWRPFLCSRVVVRSFVARVSFAQCPQVSFASRSCQCDTRARGPHGCGAPHASQGAIYFACHSPRSALATPSASQWRETMVTDLSDMSNVLSSKLGMLPDPTLDTRGATWHQFPGPWRSLVELYMSKRVEDATALDPSDVGRELIDGEDTEYRCDECSRALTPTVV